MNRLDRVLTSLHSGHFDSTVSKEYRIKFPIENNEELLRVENLAKKKDAVATFLVCPWHF
jgi:hypothetical protein